MGYPFRASPAAAEETQYLSSTFRHFCPFYYDNTAYTPLTRSVSDAQTTAGSTTITSPSAYFSPSDVGKAVSGGSIPANAKIAAYTNMVTAVLSAAPTTTASGVTVTVTTTPPTTLAGRCPAGTVLGPYTGSVFPDTQGALNDGLPALLGVEADPTHPARSVPGVAYASGSTAITSAAAEFSGSDEGRLVSGTGIPSGATILAVTSPTAAVLSAAPTAGAASGTLTVTPMRAKYLDVLVVGSDFDHNAMSKQASKEAVKAWVWAGGHLVVFGASNTTDATWLDPIFRAGITSSSTGLYAPDLDHPLLHTPYPIAYASYGKPDSYWVLSPEAQQSFTNVVVDGQSSKQVLTVSDPAAFGLGRIVLTGWKPYNLLGAPGTAQTTEAQHLLANMVLIGYQDLFIDYGPHIPANVNVVPASRSAWMVHPDLGPIAMSLVVYVFPQPS
jgi:hypothetical protein